MSDACTVQHSSWIQHHHQVRCKCLFNKQCTSTHLSGYITAHGQAAVASHASAVASADAPLPSGLFQSPSLQGFGSSSFYSLEQLSLASSPGPLQVLPPASHISSASDARGLGSLVQPLPYSLQSLSDMMSCPALFLTCESSLARLQTRSCLCLADQRALHQQVPAAAARASSRPQQLPGGLPLRCKQCCGPSTCPAALAASALQ